MFERVELSRLVYLAAVSCHKHSLHHYFFKSKDIRPTSDIMCNFNIIQNNLSEI